jgi:ABC-type glycerol-3-phosphate transport system substrate-binding protein
MLSFLTLSDTRKIFQYSLVGLFIFIGLFGMVLVATNTGSGAVDTSTPVLIWGPPLFTEGNQNFFSELSGINPVFKNVRYEVKHPETLYADTIEAMATDRGPDIILFDAGMLLSFKDKFIPISYETYPVRDFRDTFIEGAEVFAFNEGIYALPLFVDPLVLYWNRNYFTDSALSQVPKEWNTFVRIVPTLTLLGEGADIKRSAIAFGEYDNVRHAKEIVSSLILQTGTKIVEKNREGGYKSGLISENRNEQGAVLALRFYTDFSNPIKTVYSWNKTFERSDRAFASGDLAMYIGFLSEAPLLSEMNPNLNFDISVLPQPTTGLHQAVYGIFYGVGVLKTSQNPKRSFEVMRALTEPLSADFLKNKTLRAPVRRDMLIVDPSDPRSDTLVRSAIIARTWLEPRLSGVIDDYFRLFIQNVVSGTLTPEKSLELFDKDLQNILKTYK